MDDYLWLMGRAYYKPVIEYCGGTEIGGGFVTGSLLQPQALAAFSTPAMGCKLFILDSNGNPLVSTLLQLFFARSYYHMMPSKILSKKYYVKHSP